MALEEEQGLANSLEQYVANRYMKDMQDAGYRATCEENDQPLEDALKIMAALNRASQLIKQAITPRRVNA